MVWLLASGISRRTSGLPAISFKQSSTQAPMENYPDKIAAIIALQQKGYELDFIVSKGGIFCLQKQEQMDPAEFEFPETYRFESKPAGADNNVIYGLKSLQTGLKGILMASADELSLCWPGMLPALLEP